MEGSGWSGRDFLEQVCPEGCRWTRHYRKPMVWLFQNSFYFHFKNLPEADGCHKTFLCFEVRSEQNNEVLHEGVFLNQTSPFRLHTELRFLSWFHRTVLPLDENYQVIWYMSWSPCPECAEELTTFLARHRNVTLTIYVARLYYHQSPAYRKGLQALIKKGAIVKVMFFPDFLYCWRHFVENGSQYFYRWPHLTKNSLYYREILQHIFQ